MANRFENDETLTDQSKNIEQFLMEIRQLQYIINNCHFILGTLQHRPDLQQLHAQETMPLIEDYNKLVVALKEILEDQFEWESVNNKPRNLRYWKLYYELEKEEMHY